jgi:hypothetical protein
MTQRRRLHRLVLPALGACLLLAGPAAATVPTYPSGSALGEGVPLKAYATVTPQVQLFGDVITARLAVVSDTKLVDWRRLHVATDFHPYVALHEPVVRELQIGRFAQTTWTWTLRCISAGCVPHSPPTDRLRVFHFQTIHVSYSTLQGKRAYGIDATWPNVEVLSQINPTVEKFLADADHLNWRYSLSPVAAPTYRVSPTLVFWLALAAAGLAAAAALLLGARWYRAIRPQRLGELGGATASTLDRALAVLAWAHARGDETLERKALERVAGELGADTSPADADELSRAARELAWSARTPEDADLETFSERARGGGRHTDTPAEQDETAQ